MDERLNALDVSIGDIGLLQQRLHRADPGVIPDLHRRASGWYEENGFVFQAVRHALLGGDLDRVEQLVAARVLTMTYRSELATWLGLLESLPREVVRARPWLCVAYAWALTYSGRIGETERLLQDAERAGQNVGAPDDHLSVAEVDVSTLERFQLTCPDSCIQSEQENDPVIIVASGLEQCSALLGT